MKKSFKHKITWLLLILVLFAGCAHGIHLNECISEATIIYGFWYGILHGFIIIFSFIGSLIYDDIVIYAINNNGGWYDFGYIIGLGFWYGFGK